MKIKDIIPYIIPPVLRPTILWLTVAVGVAMLTGYILCGDPLAVFK